MSIPRNKKDKGEMRMKGRKTILINEETYKRLVRRSREERVTLEEYIDELTGELVKAIENNPEGLMELLARQRKRTASKHGN